MKENVNSVKLINATPRLKNFNEYRKKRMFVNTTMKTLGSLRFTNESNGRIDVKFVRIEKKM